MEIKMKDGGLTAVVKEGELRATLKYKAVAGNEGIKYEWQIQESTHVALYSAAKEAKAKLEAGPAPKDIIVIRQMLTKNLDSSEMAMVDRYVEAKLKLNN